MKKTAVIFPGIVFTGTADPWVTFDAVEQGCWEGRFPLYVTEDGNHRRIYQIWAKGDREGVRCRS